MKKLLLSLVLFIFQLQAFGANIFVDQSAPAGGDGTSWATAYQNIKSAVDAAAADDIIFIAEGIYKPEISIIINKPLAIRGGYPAGGGVQDINANITQIQADFDPSNLINTVFTIGVDSQTQFTGIRFFNCNTAIRASANLTINQLQFEQLTSAVSLTGNFDFCRIDNSLFTNIIDDMIIASSVTLQNLNITKSTFQNSTDRAIVAGPKVANFIMTDCTIKNFNNNTSTVSIQNPTAIFTNLLAENNISTSNAIITFKDSNVLIEESIFNNNSGEGIICLYGIDSQLDIIDSNLTNNSSIGASPYPVFVMNDVKLTAQNCLFKNNYAEGSQATAVAAVRSYNTSELGVFENCDFVNNTAIGTGSAILDISYEASPFINNCVFDGNISDTNMAINSFRFTGAVITNNTFKNYTTDENLIVVDGGVVGYDLVFNNNKFINNDFTKVEITDTERVVMNKNSYVGDNIALIFEEILAFESTNDYFLGNTSGTRFINFEEVTTDIDHMTMLSTATSGTHTLIGSGDDTSLRFKNSTFSSTSINDTHVRINFNDDLLSRFRNSILWSGNNNLTQSGLAGATGNLNIRYSLVKGENPAGTGNLNGTQNSNRPRFVDPSNFDFRMLTCSPTVNAGLNSYSSESEDILGNPRIFETTIDLGAYELQSPANSSCLTPTVPSCTNLAAPGPTVGTTGVNLNPTINWTADPNATGYILNVGTTSGGNDLVDEILGNQTNYGLTNLPDGVPIFVSIVPFNGAGNASSCSNESFTTQSSSGILSCTYLISPADEDPIVPSDLNAIRWNSVANADGYSVTINGSSSDLNDETNLVVTGTSHPFTNNFDEGETVTVTISPYNSDGAVSGCSSESFTIIAPSPTVPGSCSDLISPSNGATNVAVDIPEISWDAVTDATAYRVSVNGSTSNANDITNQDFNTTSYTLPTDFDNDETVTVTIVPFNAVGDAVGCVAQSFTIASLAPTVPGSCSDLISPSNGATNVAVDIPEISWDAVTDATGYTVSVNGSTSNANDITNQDFNATSYTLPADFDNDETVTVTIVPFNAVGDAVGCVAQSFTIASLAPTVPGSCADLVSPLDGATNVAVDVGTISWDAVTDATAYRVSVNGSTSDVNDITNQDFNTTSYTLTGDFDNDETVTVTIVPFNAVGDAVGCVAQSFTIASLAPTVPSSCADLASPLDGATDIPIDILEISWDAVADATGYTVSVNGSTSNANDITNQDFNTTSYTLPADFDNDETVTVTIVPFNAVGDAVGCIAQSFTIASLAPTVPGSCSDLISPSNGATNVAVDIPEISWDAVTDATGYTVSVNGSTSNANDITNQDFNTTSYTLTGDFDNDETVTVTIVPFNAVGDAVGCVAQSFTIASLTPTVPGSCADLISPSNGATNVAIDITEISWDAVTDATGYTVSVNGSTSNLNDIINQDFNTTSYTLPADFDNDETVTVTIVPFNAVGDAVGCVAQSFTIASLAPTVPGSCADLASPLDGATNVAIDITEISWDAVADATGYTVSVNGSTSNANDITNQDFNTTSYTLPADFDNDETVTVTIVPFNAVGDAVGCVAQSFTIASLAPTVPSSCADLASPLDGATNVAVDVGTISWDAVTDATGYTVSVNGSTSNLNDITNQDFNTTSYTLPADFDNDETVTVTIVPFNAVGDAVGCVAQSFTIIGASQTVIPECTELVSELNGATDVAVATSISWSEVNSADGYFLSVRTDSGEILLTETDLGILTTYTLPEDLPFATTIFVSITPYNSEGRNDSCSELSFVTIEEVEEPQEPEEPFEEDETKYGFSPDGDGINEYWHIDNIEDSPENMVMIYNRWGDLVFQVNGYDNRYNVFNGQANQKTKMGAGKLPSGTYFFTIQVNGDHNLGKLQGFVILKR